MASDRDGLKRNYAAKSDDELLDLHALGTLTELAYDALEAELSARGLPIPTRGEDEREVPLPVWSTRARPVEELPRPEHGENTSADSSTIPVFETLMEACAFLWHQRRDFVSLAAPAFVVMVILEMLFTGLFPEYVSDVNEGRERDVSGPIGLFVLTWIAIMAAMMAMFSVAWHRRYLVPDDAVTARTAYHWRLRHFGFLGALIVVGLWEGLTYILVLFPALMVLGATTEILWPEASPEQWVFVMPALAASGITEVCMAFVYARQSMQLPSAAVGRRMPSGECWKFTRGNGWRLAFIHILIVISIFAIAQMVEILQGLLFDSDDIRTYFVAVLSENLVWFVGLGLGISVLSIAYRRLMAGMPTALSTGE